MNATNLALTICLLILVAGFGSYVTESNGTDTLTDTQPLFFVYVDTATGCQYLARPGILNILFGTELTPRMNGPRHVGCTYDAGEELGNNIKSLFGG